MTVARVVFVHGLRTSATMWRRQLIDLAGHDIDAVAIDLPGHGSRIGEPFTVSAAMHALAGALPARDEPARTTVPPTLLVGLSLGGYLAVEFAARHPGRIDGLVAASCGTRPRGAGLAGYRRLAALIGRLPDRGRALNDAMVRTFLRGAAIDDVLAGGVAIDVMRPVLTAISELDPEAALARVDKPVWFVNGRFDHFRLEERRMLRATARGRLVVVPGATHLVSLSRPDDFSAVVLGAVAELQTLAHRRRA
ncbi:alpha/beta fold hydrolase [Agromyces laixinhei]|uniref:alpha/beta fold hydrolase n=1 Tax=Agromyces laixinhei TaxID=2585717 RepID=UPI0011168D22|nr:alpha/beta hydrolase [Agromyces laixinhei]